MSKECYCNQPQGIKEIEELACYLKVIADTNRLKILCLLKDGERCVCEIYEPLSLSQNLISHHLKVLKETGLVLCRKQGKWIYYRLNDQKIKKYNELYSSFLKGSQNNKKAECK